MEKLRKELAEAKDRIREVEALNTALEQQVLASDQTADGISRGLRVLVAEGQRLEEERAQMLQQLAILQQLVDQQAQAIQERDVAFYNLSVESARQAALVAELRLKLAEQDEPSTTEQGENTTQQPSLQARLALAEEKLEEKTERARKDKDAAAKREKRQRAKVHVLQRENAKVLKENAKVLKQLQDLQQLVTAACEASGNAAASGT